ncbi:MAG: Rrf2 family transcriptional regulator [Candidatus Latescibacterota bacterium]|nr:MAG: Rrf2 family transcriptional regulator [Candidatus Latescibacterota bacterium]
MRLSSRVRRAVRLTLEVCRLGDGVKPVRLCEVARATGISKRFLEQLAMPLTHQSILRGVCGRNGGYLLARGAEEITIGDVLRAVAGPVDLAATNCGRDGSAGSCESRVFWLLFEQRINQMLDEFTIADALDKKSLRSIREVLELETRKDIRSNLSSKGK